MIKDKLRIRMLFLHQYRQEESEQAVARFYRACIIQTAAGFAASAALVFAGQLSGGMAAAVCALPLLLPYLQWRKLDARIAAIKLQLLLDLPFFVNQLLLLLQAGRTLHQAFAECAEDCAGQAAQHPLADQMKIVSRQLRHGYPFARVVEDLARRCATQEMTFFTSSILMNYRRGGDELIRSLLTLSRDLWAKRKAAVMTLGEQASAKMAFPLIVIFLIVMLTVGAPAVMQLG